MRVRPRLLVAAAAVSAVVLAGAPSSAQGGPRSVVATRPAVASAPAATAAPSAEAPAVATAPRVPVGAPGPVPAPHELTPADLPAASHAVTAAPDAPAAPASEPAVQAPAASSPSTTVHRPTGQPHGDAARGAVGASTVTSGRAVAGGRGAGTVAVPDSVPTANLLDGPLATATIRTDYTLQQIGVVTVPAETIVAVTVLAAVQPLGLQVGTGDSVIDYLGGAVGDPELVTVPAGTTPLFASGIADVSSVQLVVRTLRHTTAAAAGDIHLQGAGDVVDLPFSEPYGTADVALRVAETGGAASARLIRTYSNDADGEVRAAPASTGGYPTAQGLPVELPSGNVLVWAPGGATPSAPVDVHAAVSVIAATVVSPPTGRTTRVQAPAGSTVVLRTPFDFYHRGTLVPLALTSGRLLDLTATVGGAVRPATAVPVYLVDSTDDVPVTGFSGTATYGPPVATDVTVHLEAFRTVSQATTKAFAPLAFDQPGVVYAVKNPGTASWTVDSAAASTVSVDACAIQYADYGTCQTFAAGQLTGGSVRSYQSAELLLVARPDAAAPAGTGTWSWRVSDVMTRDAVAALPTTGPGPHTATVHVAGFDASLGRLDTTVCQWVALGSYALPLENLSTSGQIIQWAATGQLTADLPVPLMTGDTFGQAQGANAWDGTTDFRGPSGTTATATISFPGNWSNVVQPNAPFLGTAGVDVTVHTDVHVIHTTVNQVAYGDDGSTLTASLDCTYGYLQSLT